MRRDDKIDMRERGTVGEVLRWGREHDADRASFLASYADELMRLCLAYDFDFSILSAQSAHETADWTSPLWNERGNPAGIGKLGVQGGAEGENQSLFYASGIDAARAHVVHMYAYSRGRIPVDHELYGYIGLDPRYEAVFKANYQNTIEVLDDFNVNGRWAMVAARPYYGDRIISKGNDMFPGQEQVVATPGGGGATPVPPSTTPAPVTTPAPAGSTPSTWQGWFDLMFGKGKWTVTQEWKNDPEGAAYDDLYDYAAGHGLDGQQHPGIDVGLSYNTAMFSPGTAQVVCAGTGVGGGAPHGGCGAYNDTGNAGPGSPRQGVGRIELYWPERKTSMIFGHSRTTSVVPGQIVRMGQQIGASGGMYGAHCHLECVKWETAQGYTYIDPRIFLRSLESSVPVTTLPPIGTTPSPPGGSMALVQSSRPTSLPKKRVPPPDMIYDMITKYEQYGSKYGYDYAPEPRKNVGVVHHETQGRGTIQFYSDFFSCPNGERCANAAVDFVIQRDGKLGMLNNPFGVWAPWANGGGVQQSGGLEGPGLQFVKSLGIGAISYKMVSVEYEKMDAENYTDAQIETGARLAAWIHDLDDQPWEDHPFVPKYGCETSMLHYWFGTTNCGKGELDDLRKVQARTREIMRQYQSGGSGTTHPPVFTTPPPVFTTPPPISQLP